MKIVYGYGRGSTEEQYETLIAQENACKAEFDYRYAKQGYTWGGCFLDAGVSGGKSMGNRPEGLKMCLAAGEGDLIIITKLDRGFRSARDFLDQLDKWNKKGVRLCLLDMQMDTSSPVGQLLASILAVVAEFERKRLSERIKDVNASLRRQGIPVGAMPYGWKRVGKKPHWRFVHDKHQREVGAKIVDWYDNHNMPYERIYWWLIKHKIKRQNGREFSEAAIKRMYHWHKMLVVLLAQGIDYPVTFSRWLKEGQQKGDKSCPQ